MNSGMSNRGWRVAKSGSGVVQEGEGGQSLVELHNDVAETIIRKEELIIPEWDKVNGVLSGICGTVG